MKVHTGTDTENALVHTLEVTTAKVHDSRMFGHLIRRCEEEVTADRAYESKEIAELLEMCGDENRVIKKKPKGGQLTREQENANRANASLRAIAKHPYPTVKCLWKQTKVWFRGLDKNASWFRLCFLLANIYTVRTKLLSICS